MRIAHVDVDRRELDLVLADLPVSRGTSSRQPSAVRPNARPQDRPSREARPRHRQTRQARPRTKKDAQGQEDRKKEKTLAASRWTASVARIVSAPGSSNKSIPSQSNSLSTKKNHREQTSHVPSNCDGCSSSGW